MSRAWPIRDKLLLGGLLVAIMVATLSASSSCGGVNGCMLIVCWRLRKHVDRAQASGDFSSRLKFATAVAKGHGFTVSHREFETVAVQSPRCLHQLLVEGMSQ